MNDPSCISIFCKIDMQLKIQQLQERHSFYAEYNLNFV